MKLPEWANWVARDEDGKLYVFELKPIKRIGLGAWVDNEYGGERVEEIDDTFETVKWEDESPTIVGKDRNTFKWLEKPDLQINRETLNEIFKSKSDDAPSLPEWANWLARDKDGKLWAYEKKPFKLHREEGWISESGDYLLIEETDDTFSHIKWADEEPTSVKALTKDFSDKAESLRELGEALTRNWEAEHGKPSIAEYNQWQITQAKAHGYDEVPEVADKTESVHVDKDGVEITSISFEEAMALVENRMENEADDIADKRYETPDIINEPNHYKGKHGIETIDVIRNFGNDDMVAGFYWGNAIKYMTRYRSKNGLEDLKKARKNLDWLIEHTEG